jgi:Toprim-like/Protein of unknown function (DUF3991)
MFHSEFNGLIHNRSPSSLPCPHNAKLVGMDEELERFKRDIKLHEYAASLGYELDRAESSKREIVLRRGADKISVRMDADGHYVYYSFRDDKDSGTIMDFVMRRQGKNFGEARKILRVWAGIERIPLYDHLEAAPRGDRAAVAAEYKTMKDLRWHDYLEQDRAIPRPVLLSPRFKGRIRVEARANAIFPHCDEDGLCGFEKRGRAFKGFADLGEKGLWTSNAFPDDRRLVVAESAIDCLSHAALFPDAGTRYASIAGGLNPVQPVLIAKACRELPPGAEVVSITHADADGDRYAAVIEEAAASLPFRLHRPSGVKDWNDVLRSMAPGLHFFPAVQ